jgi:hypothetical protein
MTKNNNNPLATTPLVEANTGMSNQLTNKTITLINPFEVGFKICLNSVH